MPDHKEHLPKQDTCPIFIVGAPRSGTTLTARILGRHSTIYALTPGETNFFEDIWSRRSALGNLQARSEVNEAVQRTLTLFERFNLPEAQAVVDSTLTHAEIVDKTIALGGGYAALYTAFTQTLAAAANRDRFCDDTPKHLYYIPTILELFPDAKIIAIVRDPRDFLNSYKNLWKRSTEGARIQKLYHPLNTTLLWKSSASQVRRFAGSQYAEQVKVLRYESLVADPVTTVRDLCAFLGVAYHEEMLAIQSHNSSFEGQATPGVFQTSVGRWREQLSAEEIWIAQRLNRDHCTFFDYAPDPVSPSYVKLAALFAGALPALSSAMRTNREKRGPAIPYLYRRLQAMLRPQSG